MSDRRLGCCDAGDRQTVRRAGDIIEADGMAKADGLRVPAMLTADTN